jgi:hypothetical protein
MSFRFKKSSFQGEFETLGWAKRGARGAEERRRRAAAGEEEEEEERRAERSEAAAMASGAGRIIYRTMISFD